MIAHFGLSIVTRPGTPPKKRNARWWQASQLVTFWSQTDHSRRGQDRQHLDPVGVVAFECPDRLAGLDVPHAQRLVVRRPYGAVKYLPRSANRGIIRFGGRL